MKAQLSLENVTVRYGKAEAVKGVSLTLGAGQIVTVIGPNGAGKSSLLNAAMGLIRCDGRVVFEGAEISRLDVEARVECGLCLVPEKRELFGEMSVLDNLALGGFVNRRRRDDSDLASVFALFPRLSERRRQRADTLSGGERQMLTLGRALIQRPRVLMLDEPSLGLAPLITREILRAVGALRSTGVSILLVEQNARAALETAEYGYILESGEIAGEGAARALLDDPRLIATYLGA